MGGGCCEGVGGRERGLGKVRGEVDCSCGWPLVDKVMGAEDCCGGTPFYKFPHLLYLFFHV